MPLPESIKKLGETLEKLITDFATLTVTTYTTDAAGNSPVLRCKTEVKLDGDTKLMVPVTDGTAIATELLTVHNDAVKHAIEARLRTIQAVVDAARAIIK